MCSPDMTVSGLEITVSVLQKIVSLPDLTADAASMIVSWSSMTVDGIEIIFNDTQLIVFVYFWEVSHL